MNLRMVDKKQSFKNLEGKKIAIDCLAFQKGKVGGLETYLLNLLEGLDQVIPNGALVTLFILENQLVYFQHLKNKFKIKTFNLNNKYLRIAFENIVLPFYSFIYDVFLFPANFRPFLVFCKTITVIHDIQYIFFPKNFPILKYLYRRMFIPISIKKSDLVITISKSVRDEIYNKFKPNNVVVVYNPIKVEKKEYLTFNDKTIPTESFFLIPSGLYPNKNIFNLLKAIEKIGSETSEFRFVFIGPFNREEFIRKFSEIGPLTVVLGYVNAELKDYLYKKCVAVIYPSIYEGFGMPYVEAILMGKPIIVSEINIAREILGDCAYYIKPPYGVEEIYEAIETFINSGSRSMIKYEKIKNSLEVKTEIKFVAERYLNCINEVLKTKPRA